MALIEQEVSTRALDRHPRRSPGHLLALEALAAVSRPPPRRGARHPGQDLLQVRGREPGRQPQAEYARSRRPTTTRRPASSASRPRPARGSGARRSRWPASSSASRSLVYMVKVSYNQKPYRTHRDGDMGREGHPEPVGHHELRPQDTGRGPEQPGQPRASRSPRRSRTRPRTPTPTTPSARCSTMCAAPDGHRPRRPRSSSRLVGDYPDVVIACCGGGSNLGGHRLPVPAGQDRRQEGARCGGRAASLPDADQGRVPLRLRRRRTA